MAQKIHKVNIGGLEYRLTSDDEVTLRNAVDLVNNEIETLQSNSDVKLPLTQLYVLVSLNLAEKLLQNTNSTVIEKSEIRNQLIRMNQLLEEKIS